MIKWILIIVLITIPLLIWVLFKPARVLAPELAGVACISSYICIDEMSHIKSATTLYDEAIDFVENSIVPMESNPKVIFCASQSCGDSFGLGKRSAITVGTAGIVIGPRAWQPHYLRHEMIHHVQFEKLGIFRAWFNSPEWFTEGMAYYLSDDPRRQLAEPFNTFRSQFSAWYQQIDNENLWMEAKRL